MPATKKRKSAPRRSSERRREKSAAVDGTRRELLEAAAKLFAEKGRDAVGVREICKEAGANIAAIAYHFGGKDELYFAALHDALAKTTGAVRDSAHAAAQASPPLAPDRILEQHIRSMCRMLVADDADPTPPRLLLRELSAPTPVLDVLVDEFMRPNFDLIHEMLDRLAPPSVDRRELFLHVFSIVGQCLHYRHTAPITLRLLKKKSYGKDFADLLARHVFSMALRGIGRADLLHRRLDQ